jgi:hypothetical protein
MYPVRSALAFQSTTLLTDRKPIGVLLYPGKQRWPRPSRLVAAGAERARIQTAATILFHLDRIRSHRGGVANRTRQRVETHVVPALLRMNELVEEYLRRIHHADGVPTEQAVDTTDASPRSRALAPSIAPRAAVSASIS